eukprot:NODE_3031_length_840_cov_268.620382.p1 GENE.NODE_3031_length_840_cov_268.620382~~NODE_3031_length_840_cov_268.620382.p1  ORF type:complete len:199 (-),score=74.23 NODE_3031_length_840_cov_268.620382:226-822(-)
MGAEIRNRIVNANDRMGWAGEDKFDATKCRLGPFGLEGLVVGVATQPNLTTLDLSDGGIADEHAVEALAEALKINSTLTWLRLVFNKIGDVGAKALADALKNNSTLETLWLTGNKIGDVGAKALADGLKSNSTLKTLWLEQNNIGNVGAKALAEALKSNTTLKQLFLGLNKIGNDGVKALRDVKEDKRQRGQNFSLIL